MSINGIGGLHATIPFHRKLMAYRSPWSPSDVLGEFYLLRGAIISAFGHADQIAMRVCVRAAQLPEYQFRPKPPTRTGERIDYLRDAASKGGPLGQYREILISTLARLDQLNEYRTIVAHASYQVLREDISFPETVKVSGARLLLSHHNSTTLAELRSKALKYARFSRACEKLYYKLGERELLPDVRFQSGWHSNLSPWREPIELPWPQPNSGASNEGE